jgi:hypothetical protein
MHYTLALEDGAWKTDDIRGKDWSPRKLLSRLIAEPNKA